MNQALIVIDVQNDYFEGGAMPVTYPANSFDNIKKAIIAAKDHQIPVVYVKHLCPPGADCFAPDSFGQELHADLIALGGDHIVTKEMISSFHKTDLQDYLSSKGIDTVTIAGFMTQMCCDTTARYAAHMGYHVNFLSDGTGTLDFNNGQGHASAEELHRATLITQAHCFSNVISTDSWIRSL